VTESQPPVILSQDIPSVLGAFDAKNRLSALLQATSRGKSFVITNHGKPVGRLVPPEEKPLSDRRAAITRLMAFGDRRPLEAGEGGIAALRAEGRR
jgi:prevent-host-death family protein